MSVEEIVEATRGRLIDGDPFAEFEGLSTDTRTLKPGELFVALKGERYDGHEFFGEALSRGARGLLVRRGFIDSAAHGLGASTYIEVDDTLYALGEIARCWRKRHPVPLLAVTGSNGKTTTKEMVAVILSQGQTVLKTEGNLNNRIGLPLTLLRFRKGHRAAILEMGMNEPGEIIRLCEIATPQYGMITQVAPAHLEGLGSIEAVAEEKGAVFRALGEKDTAIVNLDDPLVRRLSEHCRSNRVTYGRLAKGEVAMTDMDPYHPNGALGVLNIRGEIGKFQMKCYGLPFLENALAAAAASMAMGGTVDEIVAGLESFRPFPRRLNVMRFSREICLIDDTYNANPVSTEAALELLSHMGEKRTVAVIGDMRELGEEAADIHRATGRKAAGLGVDLLITTGQWAEELSCGASEAPSPPREIHACGSALEALHLVLERICEGDTILIKGSRALGLELVVDGIRVRLEQNMSLPNSHVG